MIQSVTKLGMDCALPISPVGITGGPGKPDTFGEVQTSVVLLCWSRGTGLLWYHRGRGSLTDKWDVSCIFEEGKYGIKEQCGHGSQRLKSKSCKDTFAGPNILQCHVYHCKSCECVCGMVERRAGTILPQHINSFRTKVTHWKFVLWGYFMHVLQVEPPPTPCFELLP